MTPTHSNEVYIIITTHRAEMHVGSFFNFKIWPLPHSLEVWGHFSRLKFDPTPSQWSLYFVTTRAFILHIGSFFNVKIWPLLQRSKIEKVPRGIWGEKSSKDMASSRNLVSTIGAFASPKMGDGTRCPEG